MLMQRKSTKSKNLIDQAVSCLLQLEILMLYIADTEAESKCIYFENLKPFINFMRKQSNFSFTLAQSIRSFAVITLIVVFDFDPTLVLCRRISTHFWRGGI